jgi:multidrug resistance protein, MATE family
MLRSYRDRKEHVNAQHRTHAFLTRESLTLSKTTAMTSVPLMSLLTESKQTLRLALPLIIGQLSQMLLGVADTFMVGHLGVTELATLTFVNSLFYLPFVFSLGLLTCISVHTSHARGAGDPMAARSSCRHGLYIAVAVALLFIGISVLSLPYLDRFGQPASVVSISRSYFTILIVSLLPALASLALKNHADALDRPWPPFWIFLGGVLLNILLNWILIYGKWGCPALGMDGAAWATLISRMVILVALFVWLESSKSLRDWVPFRWFRMPLKKDLLAHAKIGLPASFQMLCEVGAFSAAGFMMGRFGEIPMAAHQIAITCASSAFMIPLGLAMALTVRTGAVAGGGEILRLKAVVHSGWLLATGFGLFNAALFFFGGRFAADQFTDDPSVILLTVSLLGIVGVFQLFDSVQVASASMLRGLHDSRIPAVMGFIAYWVVGLPVAVWLSETYQLQARGVWWGLAAGLFVACMTLGPRLRQQLRRATQA